METTNKKPMIIILVILVLFALLIPLVPKSFKQDFPFPFLVEEHTKDEQLPIFDNRTMNDYFSDELVLNNLITNGDFVSSSGWLGFGSTLSLNSGIITMTGTGANAFTLLYRDNESITDTNIKYYQAHKFRVTNNKSLRVVVTYDGSTGGTDKIVITQNTPTINQWYTLSVINTLPSNATGFNRTKLETVYNNITDQNGSSTDIDFIFRFNISYLISELQYSPIYETTFDLMTDNDIKAQIDYWLLTYGLIIPITDLIIGTPQEIYYPVYQKILIGNVNEITGDFYLNNDYYIYLPPLITGKQYSPLFNTTFDLMLDNEIKLQLDAWFNDNTLPQ